MTQLYDYQREGVQKIEFFKGRVLLADEMGLGKTLEALSWIRHHPKKKPIIVVCPASLKWMWLHQIHQHTSIRGEVLNGTKLSKNRLSKEYSILIINYEILQYWLDYLLELQPQILIIDECHYIKSRSAKRTKAVRILSKKIPHIIAISGTPLTNRPSELWTTLNIIQPKQFPSFFSYAFRYCKPSRRPWGWDFSRASNLDELHSILTETMMIRRLKKDVLKELPDKSRYVVPFEIDRRKEYDEAVSDFITWLTKKSAIRAKRARKAEQLVKLGYLKRLSAELKMKFVTEWIGNYLEENEGKLVLYGIHKSIIQFLYNRYKKISVVIDGSVKNKKRMQAVNSFQKDKRIRLFIGNIQAAGVGITLTAADTLAFVELDWVPSNHIQAEDRIHRIGQKNAASIYYLVAKDTIEESLCLLIQKKQKILDSVLDGDIISRDFNIYDKLEQILKRKLV